MSRLVALTLLLCAVPQDEAVWKEIFGEVNLHSDAYPALQTMCDKIGHRLVGSENGRRAEEFAFKKFKEYGLDVHFEEFAFLGWQRGELLVAVTAPTSRKLIAYALGNTPSGEVEGEVLDCGWGTPGEFEKLGERVKGRIVFCFNGAPEGHRGVHRSEKMTLTEKYGGTAMVFANNVAGGPIQVGACAFGRISGVPGVAIDKETGDWLRRVATDEKVTLKISAKATSGPATARNVVAEIKGESDEVVMLGGHLDSWDLAVGAIDNGVGIAVVFEAARTLASLKRKPKRTIRFICFMGEEFGLYGSRAYVEKHAKELDGIAMMMNLDMCGKPSGFELYACDEALDFFKSLTKRLERSGLKDAPSSKAGLHSDHQPFMLAGVPAMTLKGKLDEEQGKYYHSAGDTFNLVKEEYLNEAAAIAAIALWELANAKERPCPRLKPDVMKERCIRDNVREPLELAGEWPFGK